MADLTIKVCDFIHPSKSAHKYIDKESVRKAIDNETFRKDLARGKILGLATHKDRYHLDDQNIPFSDNVLVSPYLANVCRKMWIDDVNECLMGEFDLLDTEYGRLMRDMYKKGIYTPVSMSVQANISRDGTKYEVSQILGVDFTGSPDLEAEVLSVSFSEKRGNVKGVYHFSQKQDSTTCKVNFLTKKFSATTEAIPTPTDLTGEQVKTDVNAMKPVPNTNVSDTKVNVTNLDTGVAGNTIENINPENPAVIKLMSKTGDRLYKIKSNEQFSLTTKFFDSIGAKYQVFSLNDLKDRSTVDKLSIDLFSEQTEDINTPEVDTSDMNKIHEDIPVEDQLSEQQIISLPNEINSQVNTNEVGFSSVEEKPKYYRVKLFNGSVKNISKQLFTKKITNNFSSHLVGKEFSDNTGRKLFVLQYNASADKYKILTDKGNYVDVFSEKLTNMISNRFNKISNFTVQSYLQELNLQPYQVLRRRVNEVIQLCRSWKQDKIHNNLENLKAYFDSYMLTWVTRVINNPNEEFNIILGLRLQNFRVDTKKMRDLNRCIKRMKTQLNRTGYMDRNIQNDLNVYFQAIENDIYEYVNAELAKSGKYFK